MAHGTCSRTLVPTKVYEVLDHFAFRSHHLCTFGERTWLVKATSSTAFPMAKIHRQAENCSVVMTRRGALEHCDRAKFIILQPNVVTY